ncbi:MAG: glycosyltransferase family 4 protein [Parvularculales bacterium]
MRHSPNVLPPASPETEASPYSSLHDEDDGPLRILLSSYRSHPRTGGQGVYIRYLTKALVNLGHKVDVISGPPYPALDERVGLIKLPSLDLYAQSSPLFALRLPMLKDRIALYEWWHHNVGRFPEPYTFGERMADYMRKRIHLYDVLHDNQTLSYGMLKVNRMGLPIVGTMHHPITVDRRIDLHHQRNPFMKFLKWRWYSFLTMQTQVIRQLDYIVTGSQSACHDAARDFGISPDRIRITPHGIDHETFRPLPETSRHPRKLIAVASADVPLKGLIYLVRAYRSLLTRYPDLELVVVGHLREGQTARELRALGIEHRVRFVSDLDDEEMTRLYAEATLAVSPSVYEGFGFPAGEAMACGVPLVATDGGSLPEVVGDAALIAPHSNPQALAEAIATLLDDPEKRAQFAKAGRQRVLDHFNWEHAAKLTVAVYREAIYANHQSAHSAS